MTFAIRLASLTVLLTLASAPALPAQTPGRITILYDAFGPPSALQKDWGFSALVEYAGKRILFDTGNDAAIFERNATGLGVDLTRLDAVIISHRHGDHTTGLTHLLRMNPGVTIYTPFEGAFFKSGAPSDFLTPRPDLPVDLRYFEGRPPERLVSGTPWEQGRFTTVRSQTEVLPGFYLLPTQSRKPGTMEMNELSLAIRTPKGLAVIVGCAHPGVELILGEAAKIEPRLYTVTGGFHLVMTPQSEVERVARVLRDDLKVERVAPGHCTSETGFAVFLDRFRERFDRAGLGAVIELP